MAGASLATDLIFPIAIADAALTATEVALESIIGSKPKRLSDTAPTTPVPMLASIISFVGETRWSYTLTITEPVAFTLVEKFCGMALPFDSDDMADAVGELVNVIAGEVTVQLEKRKLRGKMSLPTVLRGVGVELVPNRTTPTHNQDFSLPMGPMSVRLLAAGASIFTRLSVGG
jgi:chemotaxis protein CheX